VKPVFKEGAEGIDLFNQAAQKCNTKSAECPTGQLAIVLDGIVLSAPSINEPTFARDSIEISGSFGEDTAKDLATALRFGSLPLTLEPQQVQTVSATLGEGALDAGLIAGAIGVALVLAYMLLYYRILGFVTMGALALSAMVLWSLIGFLGATQDLTLTLAGIVGIVVSVGVSLDSSIVFYESLKEDVRNGRTIRSSVESSFSSAYGTIIKADMSSLIGAAVLYVMSIGPVRGFAFYLGVSTVLDLVMAYMFTRPTVRLLARSKLANRPKLFGIPTDDLVDPAVTGAVPAAATSRTEGDV
jgi:preprotein translocase subunit SecD